MQKQFEQKKSCLVQPELCSKHNSISRRAPATGTAAILSRYYSDTTGAVMWQLVCVTSLFSVSALKWKRIF